MKKLLVGLFTMVSVSGFCSNQFVGLDQDSKDCKATVESINDDQVRVTITDFARNSASVVMDKDSTTSFKTKSKKKFSENVFPYVWIKSNNQITVALNGENIESYSMVSVVKTKSYETMIQQQQAGDESVLETVISSIGYGVTMTKAIIGIPSVYKETRLRNCSF